MPLDDPAYYFLGGPKNESALIIEDFFPDVPDGYALTKVDTHKIEQEGGERAARWAKTLFGKNAN